MGMRDSVCACPSQSAFHDEIELRVKLNLPSGHIHSGSISRCSLTRRLRTFQPRIAVFLYFNRWILIIPSAAPSAIYARLFSFSDTTLDGFYMCRQSKASIPSFPLTINFELFLRECRSLLESYVVWMWHMAEARCQMKFLSFLIQYLNHQTSRQ